MLGGLNTYGYVGGNPLKNIDPLGLTAIPYPGGESIPWGKLWPWVIPKNQIGLGIFLMTLSSNVGEGSDVCPKTGDGNKCNLQGELPAPAAPGYKRCHWRCTHNGVTWDIFRYWPIEVPCEQSPFPAPGWKNPPGPRKPGDPYPEPPIQW